MPTELMEEWVGMAAFAEDSQTRPQCQMSIRLTSGVNLVDR